MARVWLRGVVVVAVAVVGFGSAAVRAAGVDAWSAMAMLEGQWREVRGSAVIDETWMNNKGNVIVGMSRTVDGLSNTYEFMRIENRKDGIVYVAQPDRDKAAVFKLTSHDAQALVFTNPSIGWPGRVEYRRTGVDTLEATVGAFNGAGKKLQFKYARVR